MFETVQEVKNDMLDSVTLLSIALGGLSLAFAFAQYTYSHGKRIKTEPAKSKTLDV
jgi:hypothetical protein